MARRKSKSKKPAQEPVIEVVIIQHEGPMPPRQAAALEEFWRLFTARVLATKIDPALSKAESDTATGLGQSEPEEDGEKPLMEPEQPAS